MAQVVQVENLSRSFGETTALDAISFSVEEGEIFGLVGPDGAGKTTCLRILCGLMAPTSGRVTVLDQDMVLDPEPAKDRIGYMAQPARLYEELSVAENIRFYADIHEVPPERYRERMNRLLEFSGLTPFTGRLFRNLSGGMKQKVGLTCALIHTPRVLFLDEPTNGVDPVSRRDFWKILYELRRERVTIVVASTYLDEVDRCHRVALFDKGKIRLLMAPPDMRSLITGHLFNLIVPDRQRALKVLRSVPLVIRSSVFGTGIHFTTQGESDVAEVEKSLLSGGLVSFEVKPITPTLEDVYLSLILSKEEVAA
ncbi:MAG: multidrug ABC transporter ATP-binding protein [Deltaproteobacteria bacterium HGW-Deltaproteobacteria-21]|nr:MAG: multidrug ABC transporter ATP-binding protein [Deltaproteobacteria bacterium HGW-Deltaproteobacteria-21]